MKFIQWEKSTKIRNNNDDDRQQNQRQTLHYGSAHSDKMTIELEFDIDVETKLCKSTQIHPPHT